MFHQGAHSEQQQPLFLAEVGLVWLGCDAVGRFPLLCRYYFFAERDFIQ